MKFGFFKNIPTEAELINSISYYENQEKGTVTAILNNCELGAIDALCRCNNGIPPVSAYDSEAVCSLMLPDKLVATVKCHPDDVFDSQVGRRLAKSKLCKKFRRYRARAWEKYFKLLTKRSEAVLQCSRKYALNDDI